MNFGNTTLLTAFAAYTFFMQGCSTPPSPKPPQASGVASKSSGDAAQNQTAVPGVGGTPQGTGQIPSVQTNSSDSYLGAKVGPEDLRKTVNDCNVTGAYYNRGLRTCEVASKSAQFPCREDGIRQSAGIRPAELPTFNTIVQNEINNPDLNLRFLFDQCVIPSTPDPDTGKVYRLKIYLAKETKVGDAVRIDTKVLRFEQ